MGRSPGMKRVALFVSCLADLAAPGPARGAVEVLEALGFGVDVPLSQTCCGQPALNSGYPGAARRLMRHWLDVFEPYDTVVSPSGSCTATVHHQYERVLDGPDRERARALADRTYELSQFVAVHGAGLPLALDATVTYHDSCHMLRSLGEHDAPRIVLGRITGLRLVEMPSAEVCCGFGGTFAAKFADLSVAMADRKLADAQQTGAHYLVSADPGCLMHLSARARAAGLPVITRHLAELLRDALPVRVQDQAREKTR
ncbi:MAG: (Fe-S)-binding protein [Carbonactinosporaceae bacterium]